MKIWLPATAGEDSVLAPSSLLVARILNSGRAASTTVSPPSFVR